MDQKKASEIAKKYVDFIRRENLNLKTAYLFGSFAKGKIGADSDIDLAIIFKNLPDTFDMQVHLMKLRRKFDTRIDAIVKSQFAGIDLLGRVRQQW